MRIRGGVDPTDVVPETQLVGALTMVHPPPVERRNVEDHQKEPDQRNRCKGKAWPTGKGFRGYFAASEAEKAKVVAKKEKEKKKRKVATVATVTDDSALASLKEFIETMGGHLPANWSAKVSRRERIDRGRVSSHGRHLCSTRAGRDTDLNSKSRGLNLLVQ